MIVFEEWALAYEKEMEASLFHKELNEMRLSLEGGPVFTIHPLEGESFFFSASLPLSPQEGALPKVLNEAALEKMLVANLFGQGTWNASLGLSADSSHLLLQQKKIIPTYENFKENIEDFTRVILFWHKMN